MIVLEKALMITGRNHRKIRCLFSSKDSSQWQATTKYQSVFDQIYEDKLQM